METADTPCEKDGDEMLDELQRGAFKYFLEKTDPVYGLVFDSTRDNAPSSIAAVGFGLAVLLIGVKHGWISHKDAVERTGPHCDFGSG